MDKKLTQRQKLKFKVKTSTLKFKRELKKSMTTAIVAAFGFLIALSWRDVITSWMAKISETSPIKGNLISAMIITVLSITGILIVSKFSHEER